MRKKIILYAFIFLTCVGIGIYYRYEVQSENHADAALQSGYLYLKNNKPLQAMGDFSFLSEYYGNRHNKTIQKIVAKGLLKKAEILTNLHDIEGAIITYEQLSNLYMGSNNKKIRYDVAKARFNQGNLLLQQKQYDEAMLAFSYLVSTYGSDQKIDIKRMIAQVMYNETVILNETGHHDTALNIHSSIVEKFVKDKDPTLRLITSRSIMARTKNRLDRKEWGIALYNSNAFIRLYHDDPNPQIKKFLLQNLLYRAEILHRVVHIPENQKDLFGNNPQNAALKTYDEILAKINASTNKDEDLPYYKSIALLGKTQILNSKHDTDTALVLCNQIHNDFSQFTNPKIRKIVAMALLTKANILTDLNRLNQASSVYDQILNKYKSVHDSEQNDLNDIIIKAYINKSIILEKQKQSKFALQYLTDVIKLYKDTQDEKLYYEISNAYLTKAELQINLQQYDQALTTYTEFIAVAHHKNNPKTRYNGADAILKKAKLQIMLHKGIEIKQTYDQLINFYIDDQNINIKRLIAQGMYDHAEKLFKNNRGYTALNTIQDIFNYFKASEKDQFIANILDKTNALNKQLDRSISW